MPGAESYEVVAGDDTGGSYLLIGPDDPHPVVYIGSEGEAGLIAFGLRDALAVLVGLPGLHNSTVVSVFEDRPRLLAWLAECQEKRREYIPDLVGQQERLRSALGLPDAHELLPAFHTAVLNWRYLPIFVPENTYYRPLLGPEPPDPSHRTPSSSSAPSALPGEAPPERGDSGAPRPIDGQTQLF